MSQNDFSVANADGATVRADINSALQALASLSSGATEPATMYAHQLWADTTANLLKIRNAANSAWVTIATWNGTTFIPAGNSSLNAGTAGGTANAQTLTPGVALGAYAAGVAYTFLPVATNTSGTVTVAVSGLATRNIKKFIGGAVVALAVGDLIISQPAMIIDDGTQFILMNPQTYTHGADVASAGTTNLDTTTGDLVDVTGTTTITAITLSEGREVTVRFTGALTLTNGASLVLPGAANITTEAGDIAVFRGYASGVVRCVNFSPIGAYARLNKNQTFTKAQRGTPVQLTDAATIATDLSLGNHFYLTIGGNRTLGQPTNMTAGQSGSIQITQDGTGSRTLAYHADWLFPGGTDPVLSTAASAIDLLSYQVNQAGTKVFASLQKGFA